jgi:hypothetical protein
LPLITILFMASVVLPLFFNSRPICAFLQFLSLAPHIVKIKLLLGK